MFLFDDSLLVDLDGQLGADVTNFSLEELIC